MAGCGGSQVGAVSVPRARTFIDLVPALPGDLDASATPTTAESTIVPSWSSELVRPRAATPGPDARLPAASAVVPYLATSWQAAKNGDYTFVLRHGVRGPTGDPFTAADVRWSIERDLAISPVAPYMFSLANIDRADPVTVLGPFTVRFNVTRPSPFLLGVLSSYCGAIYDRHLYLAHATHADPWGEQWGATHSATFGAYNVSGFLAGKRMVLLANPGSWIHPYYREVEIKQVTSSGKRLNAVLDGSADHTSGLDWSDYYNARQFGWGSHVRASILQAGPAIESWLLNLHTGPLRNPDVRRALSLAIDRAEISGQTWAGYATADVLATPPAYGTPQPGGYDLALARRLLARAGYRHGVGIWVDVPFDLGDGNQSSEISLLTSQLAQAGIRLYTVVVYDDDQLLSLAAAHQLPSAIEDLSPALGGSAFQLITQYGAKLDPASPAADFNYDDPALDRLLQTIQASPASTPTAALLARAETIVSADVPSINLFELPVQTVTRANIAGYAAYAVPVTYYEYLHPR